MTYYLKTGESYITKKCKLSNSKKDAIVFKDIEEAQLFIDINIMPDCTGDFVLFVL